MTPALATTAIRWTNEANGVGVISLCRPPVNALNWEMKRSLLGLISAIREDSSLRVIIVASDLPKTFCAGSDLFELSADHARPGSATERTRFEFEMWQALSALPQPSIAAIEGHALGSGLELAIACDFRIAGARAAFGLPEIKIGGAPGIQTLSRLPQLVGAGAARRMLLLGDSLAAEDAASLGLVDLVTPSGDALAAASTLAQRLSDQPASSVRFLKVALESATDGPIERVERSVLDGVETLFLAPEMEEGIRAFLEKRDPDYRQAEARGRVVSQP